MEDVIKQGQYVVIQRQNFTKLHKFNDLDTAVQLGRDSVQLRNISEQKWFKTFKMQLKEGGRKRVYALEPCENVTDMKEILKSIESGADNRNIKDDGQVSWIDIEVLTYNIQLFFLVTNSFQRRDSQHERQHLRFKGDHRDAGSQLEVVQREDRVLAREIHQEEGEKVFRLRADP